MELVMGGLSALAIVIFVLWLLSLNSSLAGDKAAAREQKQQAMEDAARQRREALLYRKGEPLRCLGCEKSFPGPLTDAGCPQCHLSSLVVVEAEQFGAEQKEEEQTWRQNKR